MINKNEFNNLKYSLDTNILIYAYENSGNAISDIANNLIRPNGNISNYAFQEFLFNLTKKGLLKKEISKMGLALLTILNLNTIDKDTYRYAYHLMIKHNFQLGDSIIVADAILNNCDILYSQDDMGHHGVIDRKLKIINPFE